MNNTHIKGGEGAERRRRGGGRGEEGGSGREHPRLPGRGRLVQQTMRGTGMRDGTMERMSLLGVNLRFCLFVWADWQGKWGMVRGGRGRAGEGPHTCTKERQQLDYSRSISNFGAADCKTAMWPWEELLVSEMFYPIQNCSFVDNLNVTKMETRKSLESTLWSFIVCR